MAQVLITALSKEFVTEGDGTSITITGTGFDATSNNVRLGEVVPILTFQSTTSIVFTMPESLIVARGQHVELFVLNLTTQEFRTVEMWSNLTDDEQGQFQLGPAEPLALEQTEFERPEFDDAQDFERLVTAGEVLRDFAGAAGAVLSRDPNGLISVVPTVAGKLLESTDAGSGFRELAWRYSAGICFPFAGTISQSITTERFLPACGDNEADADPTTKENKSHGLPYAGTIKRFVVYLYRSIGSGISLVRLLVNGSQVFTSGAIVIGEDEFFTSPTLFLSVSARDRVEVGITKFGTGDSVQALATVQVRTRE